MKIEWAVTIEGFDLRDLVEKAEKAWDEFVGGVDLNVSSIDIDVTETLTVEGPSGIVLYRALARRTAEIEGVQE